MKQKFDDFIMDLLFILLKAFNVHQTGRNG